MRTKFSTLAASLLLASAFVGTANAENLSKIEAGQIIKLQRSSYYSSGWQNTPDDSYYMVYDAGDKRVELYNSTVTAEAKVIDSEAGYWTVETRTTAGGKTEVRLKSVYTGKYLSLKANPDDADDNEMQEWFELNYDGTSYKNTLIWTIGAQNYSIAHTSNDPVGNNVITSAKETGTNPYAVCFDAIPVRTNYSLAAVNRILGNGFGLEIGYYDARAEKYKTYSLTGAEAFNGKLIAKDNLDGKANTNTGNTSFHIWNTAAKKYVVLTKNKWSKNGTDLMGGVDGKGYKFALMSAAEIKADRALTDATKKQIIADQFTITETLNTNGNRLEVVAVDAYSTTAVNDADAELFVAEVNGANYLTTNKAQFDGNDYVDGDADGIATYMTDTWVRFGLGNSINIEDFYGYAVTVKVTEVAEGVTDKKKGYTLLPNDADEWVKGEYVAFTKPEGQWIATTDNSGVNSWINRETGEEANEFFSTLRSEGDGIYVDTDGSKYLLTKTDKLGGQSFEYYGEFESDNTAKGEPHNYKIAFNNKTSGELNYVGVNGKGQLVLTNKVANAIVFDLAKVKKTNIMDNSGLVKKDQKVDELNILNNIMKWNKDDEVWEYKANADTISFYRYTFKYGNDKYLAYDDDDQLTLASAADYFVIKEKDNGVVNILNVGTDDYDNIKQADGTYAQEYKPENWDCGRALLTESFAGGSQWANSGAEMIYFDNNTALLKQSADIYDWVANAQLLIDDKDEVAYRTLEAPATMEFFRTEYADEFLFEHGNFLGMTYNREKYNPAIYVDTAYVRGETKKPLYMLAVGANETAATTYCPVHGVGATCEHAEKVPGLISARYLVSLTDSVAKYSALTNNPFCYTGTKLEKLGFVPATHVVDTVYIPTVGEKSDKYVINGTGVAPITFAFRIVNAETEDFVIETAKLNAGHTAYNVAYVKWHNGCPVLTEDLTEAEVFNVRSTEAEATANEAIEAAGVQVIAGKGTVTVQGAAGKVVTVANILGQTIANQVAASDNVTIAAPAGVVVVAVDGEATKVVVK